MAELPKDLDEAIAQSCQATIAAIADGYQRLQVELVFPELKVQAIAEQYIPALADYGDRLKVYFPDAGAAALARRDWGETPYVVRGISEIKGQMQPEDEIFLFIEPSSVEVNQVEKMCSEAGDRPVVLLLPRLENVATIGIGYAGRQLRDRFLNAIETCYYIRPLEGAALFRCYPSPWQIWLETDNTYSQIASLPQKPFADEIEQILAKATGVADDTGTSGVQQQQKPKRQGLLSGMKSFLRALNQ